MLPASTPNAIVGKMGNALVRIMQTPEVARKSEELGFRVDPRGPKAFGEFWNSEVQRWRAVIKAANIKAE